MKVQYILGGCVFAIMPKWRTRCGPRILAQCVPHLNGELNFYFEKWFLLIKKNDLESPLIFVLFLKGKQNKKEKP